MDRLAPEHLHLLFDEPIYVLEDHGDHPIEEKSEVNLQKPKKISFQGNNKKGFAIFIEEETLSEDNRNFLFKGLNALDLSEKDIALIVGNDPNKSNQNPPHSLRLVFSASPDTTELYTVINNEDATLLHCNSLTQIQQSQDLKVKFWLGLKALLGKS